ncbi:uncharacterized protein LOC130590175 [Beta vulgaris subsp. vulgaris]|uniref:uncharacterized protein LOC130590175 n=1 Tax=Beta vulgaris subsp. vulgaris TaxID=3555 RepID=UPI00254850C3|nr:uncharacterized protein LOC130590175 [Beta vulgaris subsp. vulgaris]
METVIDSAVLDRIRIKCGFTNGICCSSVGNSGGMGCWWNDLAVKTHSYSTHHFAADILDRNNIPLWRAIGIYGWPESGNKYKTWELMGNLKAKCTTPCIMFGDFNEVLCHAEKEGGVPRSERCFDAFHNAIDNCGLVDLGFKGCMFTWQRGTSPASYIRERLDRYLADDDWCTMLPNYSVRHFPIYSSDHAPILLQASNYFERGRRDKMFRFEALWLSREDCGDVISNAWKENSASDVCTRLSRCARDLTK